MTAEAPGRAVFTGRRPRPGTTRRRNVVVLELLLITAGYLVAFFLLVDPMRRLEVEVVAGIFRVFGSRGVSIASADELFIAHGSQAPIIADISRSCSSLMGLLALAALALAVLRRRRLHTLAGYIAAGALVFAANTARESLSVLAGLAFGRGWLILFHDWVGTVWNFVATLVGFLLMLYFTMPTPQRAEQDRSGRHSAHRPESWARIGLGYRVPMLVRPHGPRRTFTGWFYRHFLPPPLRRRMAARRERGRINYQVGFLDVDQRKQAIARLAADGLEAHGATLLALATYEEDTTVLDALASAVAQYMPHAATEPVHAMLAYWSRGWLGTRDPASSPRPIPGETWRLLAGRRRRRAGQIDLGHVTGDLSPGGALESLVLEGLEYHKAALLALAATETDRAVLRVLAQAIAARQWEPTASDGNMALRLFARARLTVPAEPVRVERRRRRRDRSGSAPHPAEPFVARRVAVTGVGGPAGYTVCRALRSAGHEVFGLDPDPLAAGFQLEGVEPVADLRADDERFGERFLELAAEHRFEAVVSTVAEELAGLIAIAPDLARLGCANWFPPLEAVEVCLDKARFAATMQDYGIPHPPTATTVRGSRHVPGPYVVKPRRGRGSRGVSFIDARRQMKHTLRKGDDLIVQSRLAGEEWTADVLVDRNGRLVGCVPRWRLEVRGGISVKGSTFDSQDVTRVCAEALAAVGLTGVANVQGVLDPTGHAATVEINPRFSGGLALSLAAGSDFVAAYLEAVLHPGEQIAPLYFRPRTRMVRHFEEQFGQAPP